MDYREIRNISLSTDLKRFAEASLRDDAGLEDLSKDELFNIVREVMDYIVALINDDSLLPREFVPLSEEISVQVGNISANDVRGLYYASLLITINNIIWKLIDNDKSMKDLSSYLLEVSNAILKDDTGNDVLDFEQGIVFWYIHCVVSICQFEVFNINLLSNIMLPRLRMQAAEYLSHLTSICIAGWERAKDPADEQVISRFHVFYGFKLLNSITQNRFVVAKRDYEMRLLEDDAFHYQKSALIELPLLASRSDIMEEKYRIKTIEKVFERHLSTIFQSFGFLVARTNTGERTVDMVCIHGGSDNSERMTIIVEAKTTSKPYSMPASDERALLDYIEDVRKSLKYHPPLKFVLLIGPEPSRTLAKKIARLEKGGGITVRFCNALDIAMLRAAVPGPLPIESFADCIIGNGYILPTGVFQQVVTDYQEEQESITGSFRTMLKPVVQRRSFGRTDSITEGLRSAFQEQ